MNLQIKSHQRDLVIITDAQIKVAEWNFVYKAGVDIEEKLLRSQIFIKDCRMQRYVGKSWPDASVWPDYLNDYAQAYWATLYSYEVFIGTS